MASLVIALPKLEDAKHIRNILVSRDINVHSLCTNAAQVLIATNELSSGIVLCGYKLPDMFFRDLNEQLPVNFKMLLVASKRVISNYEDIPIASLSMPFTPGQLVTAIHSLENLLRGEVKKRDFKPKSRSVKDQKLIDDAKAGLMLRNNMTESEAHKYLQKTSMDSGRTIVETAGMVLALLA